MATADDSKPPANDCRADGCQLPQSWNSIFCDEHHEAMLRRAGLTPPGQQDPTSRVINRIARLTKAFKMGIVTESECVSNIYNHCLLAYSYRNKVDLDRVLASLPSSLVASLAMHLDTHPDPPQPRPMPTDDAEALQLKHNQRKAHDELNTAVSKRL